MKYTDEQVVEALNERDPRNLGPIVHPAVLRVSPGAAVEAVALRNGLDGVEVLLSKRGANAPSYVGQYHCPGSFVRSGESEVEVLDRLTASESLGRVLVSILVGNKFILEERGWYVAMIYLVAIEDPPDGASWFPVDNLPEPTIDHHRNILIPEARKFFETVWCEPQQPQ